MDERVFAGFYGEFSWWGAHVSLFVPIGFEAAVDAADKHVVPEVELPPIVEQWVFYVFL